MKCALVIDDDVEPDRGSASLTIVLLAPLLLVLMFAGFQAAMWNHTRTEARVIALETAVLVARDRIAGEHRPVLQRRLRWPATAC